MLKDRFFQYSDKIVKYFIKDDLLPYKGYYAETKATNTSLSIAQDMQAIDSKSSSLLAHISIMFVVISFFIGKVDKGETLLSLQHLFLFELIAYLLIGLMLLRCVDIMGPPFRTDINSELVSNQDFLEEIAIRRFLYTLSIRCTFLLSIVLVPLVIIKYF